MPVTDFDMKLSVVEAESDQLWASARSILPLIKVYAGTGEEHPIGRFCANLVMGHILLAQAREAKEKLG